MPAYWLALLAAALIFSLPGVLDAGGIPIYFGFGQIYFPERGLGGLPQAWTLCVEVSFYAFLPLYAWLVRRFAGRGHWLRAELGGLAILIAASQLFKLAAALPEPYWHANHSHALFFLPAFLDHFALGMGLAVLTIHRPRITVPAGAAWAGAVAAFVLVAQVGPGPSAQFHGFTHEALNLAQLFARHWLYALVALLVLLPVALGDPATGFIRRRILGNRLLLWTGLLSYGIYLWHLTVVDQLARWDFREHVVAHPYLFWPALTLIGTLAIAAASYFWVERPLLGLKSRVRDREPPAFAEPAP